MYAYIGFMWRSLTSRDDDVSLPERGPVLLLTLQIPPPAHGVPQPLPRLLELGRHVGVTLAEHGDAKVEPVLALEANERVEERAGVLVVLPPVRPQNVQPIVRSAGRGRGQWRWQADGEVYDSTLGLDLVAEAGGDQVSPVRLQAKVAVHAG